MNSKKVTTDKYSMTKGSELYAFWEYDTPPYVLGGVVTKIKDNGDVCVKGFNGSCFTPTQILPLDEGLAKQMEIDLAMEKYNAALEIAKRDLNLHTSKLLLKYTLTEIGRRHVEEFLEECVKKRKEILEAAMDTAYETHLPTVADILFDLNNNTGVDDSGEYSSSWCVTDNDTVDFSYVECRLKYGIDYR